MAVLIATALRTAQQEEKMKEEERNEDGPHGALKAADLADVIIADVGNFEYRSFCLTRCGTWWRITPGANRVSKMNCSKNYQMTPVSVFLRLQ